MKRDHRQIFDFVLTDLEKDGKSVYNSPKGLAISLGSLHSGTTFTGLLSLSKEEMQDIETAIENDIHPVFSLHFKMTGPNKEWRQTVQNNVEKSRKNK